MTRRAKTQPNDYLDSVACQQHLQPFLKYLFTRHEAQGGITELRAGRDWYGYFRPQDLDKAVSLLAPAPGANTRGDRHPRIGEGLIRYSPHPVSVGLYARSPAKFTKCEPADTSDLVAYSTFTFRIEPNPQDDAHTSDEARRQVALVARENASLLREDGVPVIVIDAGSWFELLVPTTAYEDVRRAAASADKMRRLIDEQYSNDAVAVARTNSGHAAHYLPLPGTLLAAGDPSTEPLSRFVRVRSSLPGIGDEVDLLSVYGELLAAVSSQYEPDEPPDDPDEPDELPPHKKKQARAATKSATGKPPKKKRADATTQPDEPDDSDEDPEESEDAESAEVEDPEEPEEPPISKPRPKLAPVASWDGDTAAKVLAEVLKRGDREYRIQDKKGERHYQLRVCPYLGEPDDHDHECAVVVRADGKFEFRCGHNENARWKDLRPLLDWDTHIPRVLRDLGVPARSAPYRSTDTGLFHLVKFKTRTERVRLSNFTARIVRDVEEDDGVEQRHTFEVEAKLGDQTSRCTLSAAQFAAMTWPLEHLGAGAILYPAATKALLRAAIQELSSHVGSEKVYKHTGWRTCEGKNVYLHAGGAIGAQGVVPGVRVDLPEPLSGYRLPEPPEGAALRDAIRASLRFLEAAPETVTIPLYGCIFRSALGRADFAVQVTGPSGAGKSSLVALVLGHWGPEWSWDNLPTTWKSTSNYNAALAFLVKDAVLGVDDFAPTGDQGGSTRQHQEADNLLRGQANRAGRGRLRSDASLRPPRPPRGLIISTGEATPRGQSLRARILVIEMSRGMLDTTTLSPYQQDARQSLYAAAFSGFIRWLAPRLGQIQAEMPARLAALRLQATSDDLHRRTPATIANLAYGLELFAEFAVEAKAMTRKQAESFLNRCWKALGEAAAAQAEVQGHGDTAKRFLSLLQTALKTGKAHVAGARSNQPDHPQCWGWRQQGDGWAPCGSQIGWVDGTNLYLDPAAATVAKSMAEGGEAFNIGDKSLHKRLHEGGFLVQIDKARERLLIRKTLGGKQRDVLALVVTAVVPEVLAPLAPPVAVPLRAADADA
jgi:hypothetical protein